ncbi:unnamed protein product [Bursaphelenchus okinawaensis]|uniref:DNA mismatch repair proteins mutS family domain-containing protein n=1 Tax=Bursaphelenchus okinawaensis TaxID=465554 RepID=A0A811JUX2_9BILA|nr:unnamed protein product [Bursaphelenchus okinawaensis]CAG9083569.1 unnamed protein product [Bursaphelenchus okinawaensis]
MSEEQQIEEENRDEQPQQQRSTLTSTVLTVFYDRNKLGAACYDEAEKTIQYLNDTPDDDEYNTLRYLVERIKPTHVIANAGCKKDFRKALQIMLNCYVDDTFVKVGQLESTDIEASNRPDLVRPYTSVDEQSEGNDNTSRIVDESRDEPAQETNQQWTCSLQFISKIYFGQENGMQWLSKVLDFDGRDATVRTKMLFEAKDTNMIGALGALLRHINQIRLGIEFDNPTTLVPVDAFKAIILGDIIYVDPVTKKALAIFESDTVIRKVNHHKNASKKAKTLFELCDFTKSSPGKRKLRFWFSRPLRNKEILKIRQEGVMFFAQDTNYQLVNFLRARLRNVHSLMTILVKLSNGRLAVVDWISLSKTINALIEIGDSLRNCDVNLTVLGPGEKCLGGELARIGELLKKTFNQTESIDESRFVVNEDVSPELDHLKSTYSTLGEHLTKVAEAEINNYGIPSCSVCYLPIIGYMLMIPIHVAVHIEHEDFEKVYSTENSVGFKTPGMLELDRVYGDIRSRIIDRETVIANSLQELIAQRKKVIVEAMEVAATLDSLISLGIAANKYEWIRPHFSDKCLIKIEGARQPLVDSGQNDFVPNDIKSASPDVVEGYSKVKLIAGPNASGKSVYLKMVGVIVYLAHVGSYVPAKKAEIGPVSQIISRMYTVDSVLDGLSSFASDLKQMSHAIRKTDANSLVLIDEFGKGTMTEVGIGLLAGCLNYWLEKPRDCPHIFLATHFCSLPNYLIESPLLAEHKMEVLKDDDNILTFTFRFVNGLSTHSYASFTAAKMGIPPNVVKRADQVYDKLKRGKTLTEVEGHNQEEEKEYNQLVQRMEQLYDDFVSWDMTEDAAGFVELAKKCLNASEEDDQVQDVVIE